MARSKAFNEDAAVDAAIEVFREHGFEGTSAQMLVEAMGIGRQSLYDTFGDKWQLYRAAVRRYGAEECAAHIAAVRSGPRAVDGLVALLSRVVGTAARPCLGIGSVCEFGTAKGDIVEIRAKAGALLRSAIAAQVALAQRKGDVATDLDPEACAEFVLASVAGIRVAGRGGADRSALEHLAAMALRAFR